MKKRILSCLVGAAVVVAGSPGVAFADDSDIGGPIQEDTVVSADSAEKLALVTELDEMDDEDSGSDTVSGTGYTVLDITIARQKTSYYCAPAAVRAALSVHGVTVSQGTLADKLGTTSKGTAPSAIPAVLNAYQDENDYVLTTSTSSGPNLYNRVVIDVDRYESALVAAVQGSKLPLWDSYHYYGYHAITLYGYSNSANIVSYFDPINNDLLYGKWHAKAKYVYQGLNVSGNRLVW